MPNLNHVNRALPREIAAQWPALTVTVPEACRISGYSRSELYRRLASGDLEAVKIGRATRILVASIERSVAALPRAQFNAYSRAGAKQAATSALQSDNLK